ncbi:MAG: hypothetical protein KF767_18335 [Bdellovibrionaceae bacterium]|nr:hypothetical protein [Pseudobdellovibrionaceae bacterium]
MRDHYLRFRSQALSARHARLLKVRSGVAAAMVVLIGLAIFEVEARYTLIVSFFLFVVFLILVSIHRRVRGMRELYATRARLAARQLALKKLDWDGLPAVEATETSDMNEKAFIHDLNLIGERSLLRLLDQTFSDRGRRVLWERLTLSRPGLAEIERRQSLTRELLAARGLRWGLLTRLTALNTETEKGFRTERLRELAADSFSQIKGVGILIPLILVQMLMLVGLGFAALGQGRPWMSIPLLLVIGANLYLRGRVDTGKAYRWSLSAGLELGRFREAVYILERFAKTSKPVLGNTLAPFRNDLSASSRLRRLESYGGYLGVRQNFIVQILVNLIWPWDLWWTQKLDGVREEIRTSLPKWIEALAEVEAGVAIAQYSEALVAGSWPEFRTSGPAIVARGLRHPLLAPDVAIGNDLELDETTRTLLLTGSNMSGKSTFLRTVGANFLLARAGARVPAKELIAWDLEILTSLSAADSLQEGLSSFYAEVVRLKSILQRAEGGAPVLFLIDEIFRGTNNRERLAGSRAYIEALVRTGARGIVSSHDLELAHLEELGVGVVNAHFRETIAQGKMSFTYRLQKGPCPTTNALEVMRGAGLPVS